MFYIINRQFRSKLRGLALIAITLAWAALDANTGWQTVFMVVRAQSVVSAKAGIEPVFRGYKGIQIGMSADDARQKLGGQGDKSDRQDFFTISEKESAQIFYDEAHKVTAISVNYLDAGTTVPTPKAVLGTDLEAKPDGSMYRLVRYQKAGYWVSYSRTAGPSPLVTITMQKISN